MGNYHRVIGIDLGTTYSVVAAYDLESGTVKVIPNRQNENTTPSVVYISPTGQVSVGKSAKKKQMQNPEGVLIEVKRLMGAQSVDGSSLKAKLGQQSYDPESISAFILKELKGNAERFLGEPIHDVVITVPAYFKEPQKNATREAAKIARLNPRMIINEPTAAALAYAFESPEVVNFIVYDFGGGTFDVSVVRVETENTVEILGTGGDSNLGGGDIDAILVSWVLGCLQTRYGSDFSSDPKFVGKLRLEAESLKIDLCNEWAPQKFYIENPVLGEGEVTFELTPAKFEELISPLLARTFSQVEIAMASATENHGVTLEDIEAIVLVGGSSKIPLVSKLIKERFKKNVKENLNPDEIVAMGAARMAMNYLPSEGAVIKDNEELRIDRGSIGSDEIQNTNIKDVVSHTLGVGLVGDIFDPLIPKDSVIPASKKQAGYTTSEDNQTSILVPVHQGENKKASLNTKIGEIIIPGLKPEPKGVHQFQISFALDSDGIFFGEVLHIQTGESRSIKLDRGKDQMTEPKRIELAEMVDAGVVKNVPNSPRPTDGDNKIADLVAKAQAIVSSLPADKREPLDKALSDLEQARSSRNEQAIALMVINLTMQLMTFQI